MFSLGKTFFQSKKKKKNHRGFSPTPTLLLPPPIIAACKKVSPFSHKTKKMRMLGRQSLFLFSLLCRFPPHQPFCFRQACLPTVPTHSSVALGSSQAVSYPFLLVILPLPEAGSPLCSLSNTGVGWEVARGPSEHTWQGGPCATCQQGGAYCFLHAVHPGCLQ